MEGWGEHIAPLQHKQHSSWDLICDDLMDLICDVLIASREKEGDCDGRI